MPAEIAGLAACRLGEQFGLSRVFFATLRGSMMTVEHEFTHGVGSIVGEHDLAALAPELLGAYRDGAVITVKDVGTDERFNEQARSGLHARQVGAYIDVVLFEEDQSVSLLAMQSVSPRNWTTGEEKLFREVGERVRFALARARAEAALSESEERQAFLLKLSDALRPLADPNEVQSAAARLLGEHLKVDRANYYEVDADGFALTLHGYSNGALTPPHRIRIADFGQQWLDSCSEGHTVVVSDMTTDQRSSDQKHAAWRASGLSGALGVPLVKGGRFCAVLGLSTALPRIWTAAEVALVEEVAKRTWAAVERVAGRGRTARERRALPRPGDGRVVYDLSHESRLVPDAPARRGRFHPRPRQVDDQLDRNLHSSGRAGAGRRGDRARDPDEGRLRA